MKSLAALFLALLALIGIHWPPSSTPSQAAAVVLASTEQQPPVVTVPTATQTQPSASTSTGAALPVQYQGGASSSAFVTQDQLTMQLAELADSLRAFVSSTTASNVAGAVTPEYVAANGNGAYPYAGSNRIDNLSNVTISNPTITGGNVVANSFSGTLGVSNGGTGWTSIASGYIPFGNGASALATSTNLFWDNVNSRIGVGTTSPFAALSVNGNGYLSGNLNVGDASTTRSNLGLAYATTADVNNNVEIAAWGDSLTAGSGGNGTTYETVLSSLSGYSIYNGGVGGQTSTQIEARMVADTAKYSWPTIIWAGRNNYTSPSTVEADIANMVAALQSVGNNNYIILSIINGDYGSYESSGGAGYNFITSINSYLASTYGSHYLDVRSYLVSQYNSALPLDIIDHSNDVPPTSLHSVIKSGTLGADIGASDTSFTLNYTTGTLAVGDIISIDGERILVGSGSSGSSVANATRGYYGTTATSHTSGTAFNVYDQIHLSAAGYTAIANYINQHISILQQGTTKVLTTGNVAALLSSPPVIGGVTQNAAYFSGLGIGTTSPAGSLDVNGTAFFRNTTGIYGSQLQFKTSSGAGTAAFLASGNGSYVQVAGSGLISNTDGSADLGYSTSNYRFNNLYLKATAYVGALNSTGNILYGTSTFGAPLEAGDDGSTISKIIAAFGQNNSTGAWVVQNAGNPTTRRLLKGYNGTTEAIRLNPAGGSFFDTNLGLGVGTTSNIDTLDVTSSIGIQSANAELYTRNGNSATTISFDFPELTTQNAAVYFFKNTNTTGGTPTVTIFKADGTAQAQTQLSSFGGSFINALGGNLGVGTSTPTSKLEVAGNIQISSSNGGIYFRKSDTSGGNSITLAGDGATLQFAGSVVPFPDNTYSFGISSQRWNNIRIGTGDSMIAGRLGVGTTSLFAKFAIQANNGDTNSTLFAIASSTAVATTTLFSVNNQGNVTIVGSAATCTLGNGSSATNCSSSDQRLKDNIAPLDASSSLSAIRELNPVSFKWNAWMVGNGSPTTTQFGFIAQQVAPIFGNLVTQDQNTHYFKLDYQGLFAPIVGAIQAISSEIDNLTNTVAGFALNFVSAHVTATVGDFDRINTKELCADKSDGTQVCVTGDQLAAVLAQAAGGNSAVQGAASAGSSSPASTTAPTIEVNGSNPAVISVGDNYADMGATITGPAADLNLGIKTFLNGALVSNIVVDTAAVATDTIDYVVTDQNGLSATSTRTVIIQAGQSAGNVEAVVATSSPAVADQTASSTPAQ